MSDDEDVWIDVVGDGSESLPISPASSKRRKPMASSAEAMSSDQDDHENRQENTNKPAKKVARSRGKNSPALQSSSQRQKTTKKALASQELVDGLDSSSSEPENEGEDEEEDLVVAEKASKSASRQKRKKRPVSGDDEEDFGLADDDEQVLLGKENEEGDLVGQFEEDEEDSAEHRLLMRAQKNRAAARSQKGVAGHNEGIIEKMTMQNFMCHEHVEIDFGSQINFITGQNGSGKSAILVGLALCLGATTAFTQRANKLGGFVREGQNKAVVTVQLCNRGDEAFKPELYGPSIIVERTIVRSTGQSKYKLKNYKGAVVSTDRSELAPMMDRFNIQVNNPCIIMMQETSRDFLGGSTPRKKYELFERATQIKMVSDHLNELLGDIADATKTKERKKALLPAVQRQYDAAKKEHDQVAHLREVKEKMRDMKAELVWAHVAEKEATLKEKEELVVKLEQTLERNTSKVTESESRLEARVGEEAVLAQKLRGIGETNDTASVNLTRAKEEFEAVSARHRKVTASLKALPKKLSQLENRLKALNDQISAARAKAASEQGEEERRRFEQTEALKRQKADVEAELASCQMSLTQARAELAVVSDESQQARGKASAKEREAAKLESDLRNLRSADKDPAALWGTEMPAVLKLIRDNKSKFKRAPLGPLGMHIKLQDGGKFAANGRPLDASKVVETFLSKIMGSFWCDNYADSRLLGQLCEKERIRNLRMVVQPFRDAMYADVRVPAASDKYVRMMDCITCEPPGVWNVVIDQLSPEGVVLVHDSDFGGSTRLLDEMSVHRVMSTDGSTKSKTRTGDVRQQGGGRQQSIFRMGQGSSRSVNIKSVEQKLATVRGEKNEAEQQRTSYEHRFRKLDGDVKEYQSKMYQLQDKQRMLEVRIAELDRPLEGTDQSDLLLEKVRALELSFEEKRTELQEGQAELAKLEAQVGQKMEMMKLAEEAVDEMYAQSRALEDQAREVRKKVAVLKAGLETARKVIGEQTRHLEGQKEELVVLREELEKSVVTAMQAFPERRNSKKSVSQLTAIVLGMEQALEKSRQDGSGKTVEEIEKDYDLARRKLVKVNKSLEWLDRILKAMAGALKKRQKKLGKIRELMGNEVSTFFNMYLTKKGYEGQTKFIHDPTDPSLDVIVNLNPANSSQASQDALSLSGGETSFSTVALILSLWEVIDTPFRVMDEFDIFMDGMHRKLAINMLVEFARTVSNRQFIFLSPLDTKDIPKAADIMVRRLDPPVRAGLQQDIRNFVAQ